VATYNKFDTFVEHLGLGYHDFTNHVLQVYLTNNTPSNSADVWSADLLGANIENGYDVANVSQNWTQSGGVASLKGVTVQWTANGGSFGPFEYVVLMNANATDGNNTEALIGWWDYGSSISCNNGESFTWQTPANNLIANFA
jgi:hypothetical protein